MSSRACGPSVADLERVAALGWRGTEEERLGDWLLRASGGFTGRANSVLPVGDPGRPMDDAVATVTAWYAARGLRPRFLVPLPDAAEVDDALAAAGWELHDPVHVLVAPVEGLVGGPGVDRVRVDGSPDDAWVGAYHYRGGGLPAHARDVLEHGDTLAFASVRGDDGAVLAIARGSVDAVRDGTRWLGVTAVEVDPSARRRGLGTLVLRGLAGWAQKQGATCCYLQVAAENHAALALYAGAGFTRHHGYQYRLAPVAARS